MPLKKAKSKLNRNENPAITKSAARSAYLYTVKGRVQGVWFRDSTRREAMRLNITGYAKNLTNGDVEVLACGSSEAVQTLRLWLQDGPPMAKVSDVIEQPTEYELYESFQIS